MLRNVLLRRRQYRFHPLLGRIQRFVASSSCLSLSLLLPQPSPDHSVMFPSTHVWSAPAASDFYFPSNNACWSVLTVSDDMTRVTHFLLSDFSYQACLRQLNSSQYLLSDVSYQACLLQLNSSQYLFLMSATRHAFFS